MIIKYIFFITRYILKRHIARLDSTSNAIVTKQYVDKMGNRKGF